MRIGYCTTVFRQHPLTDAVEAIGKAGFCAVDLMADKPHGYPPDLTAHRLTELQQDLARRKLVISSLNSCTLHGDPEAPNPSWLDPDWRVRERRVSHTMDCLRLAAALGVRTVVTPGGGPLPDGMNAVEASRLFAAGLNRVLALAQRLRVKLLLRPDPGILVATSGDVLSLLREMEFPPFLGVCFDAAHLFCAGESPAESWGMLEPHVGEVFIGDVPADRTHRHLQLGDGAVDLPRLLHHIRGSAYDGFVVVNLGFLERNPEDAVYGSASYLVNQGFLSPGYCPL